MTEPGACRRAGRSPGAGTITGLADPGGAARVGANDERDPVISGLNPDDGSQGGCAALHPGLAAIGCGGHRSTASGAGADAGAPGPLAVEGHQHGPQRGHLSRPGARRRGDRRRHRGNHRTDRVARGRRRAQRSGVDVTGAGRPQGCGDEDYIQERQPHQAPDGNPRGEVRQAHVSRPARGQRRAWNRLSAGPWFRKPHLHAETGRRYRRGQARAGGSGHDRPRLAR